MEHRSAWRFPCTSSLGVTNLSVGVVIPAYNCAHYLDDAIRSALGQTYQVREVVVVDDGSTDDCRGVVSAHAARVTYLRIDNSGPARARNVGMAALSTDLVAFLDGDDIWHPEKIARQVARMQEPDLPALVYCGKTLIDASGRPIGPFDQHEFPQGDLLLRLIAANHISTTSVAVARRQVLLDLGGFQEHPDLRWVEDYELWLRCASRFTIGSVAEPLVRYRVHGTNLTRNLWGRYLGLTVALDCFESFLQRSNRRSPEIDAALRARRIQVHEEFAIAFLYVREYGRARAAAGRLAGLRPARWPPVLAFRHLPDWMLRCGQNARQMLRSVR